MLSALAADGDLRGERIDVSWSWSGPGARPAFRLLRGRRAYPAGPDDGWPVLDLGELFGGPDLPWARVSRVRYQAAGSGAEGGLLQGALTLFRAAPGASPPAAVEVALVTPAGALVTGRVDEVTRVERTLPAPGAWTEVEALELFRAPPGDPETPAGVVTVFRGHGDGVTPDRLRWQPAGGPALDAPFDAAELLQTTAQVRADTDRELHVAWTRVRRLDGATFDAALSPAEDAPGDAVEEEDAAALREEFSDDAGEWTRSLRVSDRGAATGETSYYALFRPDPADPGAWTGGRAWRARAASTARYGFAERMYGLLPSLHRYYDEPTPDDRGRGQLRRYLQVFGTAMDHLRGSAEGLRTRHDLAEVREDFLPALGEWIGWTTDRTAPLPAQRSEIGMAPAVFETVGTLPNLVALAGRATGWPCQAKEFVENLFRTNAPEYVPVRELWEMAWDGAGFGPPVRLGETGRFDGRPAAVVEPGGRTRLVWHSSRGARWELWTRMLDGGPGSQPARVDPPPADAPPPAFSDLAPAMIVYPAAGGDEVWLFWESDREGARGVWARLHDGTDWGTPFRVTDHARPDRRPTAALGPGNTLWVFWESERRGPGEIWSRTWDGTRWTPPVRVTESLLGRDREPAAAMGADGRLWLVWRRDESGRSRLYARVLDGAAWGPETPLEDGPWRDESPALALRGGELWLLWSSERTGRWELWARTFDGAAWAAPFQVTRGPNPDKEPALVPDGGNLRIFWRAERPSARHRSRTVDTGDVALLERRGRFADRLHYTYDTQRGEGDWYARDVVGVYVTPPAGTPSAVVAEVLDRARTWLEPFCPATVRVVLVPDRPLQSADFSTDGFDLDEPIVDSFEDDVA